MIAPQHSQQTEGVRNDGFTCLPLLRHEEEILHSYDMEHQAWCMSLSSYADFRKKCSNKHICGRTLVCTVFFDVSSATYAIGAAAFPAQLRTERFVLVMDRRSQKKNLQEAYSFKTLELTIFASFACHELHQKIPHLAAAVACQL